MRKPQARARATNAEGRQQAGAVRDPHLQRSGDKAGTTPATAKLARLADMARTAPATAKLARLADMARTAPTTVQLASLADMARATPATVQPANMSAKSAPIQRVISNDEWTQIEQGISDEVHAVITITKDQSTEPKNYTIRYKSADAKKPRRIQVKQDNGKWVTLKAGNINKMKVSGVWNGEFKNVHPVKDGRDAEVINNDRTAPASNITGDETGSLEMDVQSNKANDRLALVHRSLSLYKRNGQNKQGREHLTLENEHMLAMLAQQRDKSSVYYAQDKFGAPKVYDKKQVNDALKNNFSVRVIDNLNFYLTKNNGGKEADMQTPKPTNAELGDYDAKTHDSPELPSAEDQLSLHDYLTFVARALKSTKDKSGDEITPSVYGVKYEKLLEGMEAQMGINPRQAFLDSSDVGHRKKFIQAVLVMRAKGIVKELQNEAKWKKQYEKYHERPPVLLKPDGKSWTEIRSGQKPYNDLDRDYANEFYRDIRNAVLNYND